MPLSVSDKAARIIYVTAVVAPVLYGAAWVSDRAGLFDKSNADIGAPLHGPPASPPPTPATPLPEPVLTGPERTRQNEKKVIAAFAKPFSTLFGTQTAGNLCKAFSSYKALTCEETNWGLHGGGDKVSGTVNVDLKSKDGSTLVLQTQIAADGSVTDRLLMKATGAFGSAPQRPLLETVARELLGRHGLDAGKLAQCQAAPKALQLRLSERNVSCAIGTHGTFGHMMVNIAPQI